MENKESLESSRVCEGYSRGQTYSQEDCTHLGPSPPFSNIKQEMDFLT